MKLRQLTALATIILISYLNSGQLAHAASTSPLISLYKGELQNSSGTALSGQYDFRVSFWSDSDWDSSDTNISGDIEPTAVGYSNWKEVHRITLGDNGSFNIYLGSIQAIQNLNINTHTYLQIEVKSTSDPNTAYEVLDVTNTLADTNDRHAMTSNPFAMNADLLDGADIGTSEDNLATLSSGGVWDTARIPSGTNLDEFIIDHDNTASGNIRLQLGNDSTDFSLTFNDSTGNTTFSTAGGNFNFTDDNLISSGNLTISGKIDFSGATQFRIREDTNPNANANCTNLGELIYDTSDNEVQICTSIGSPGTWNSLSNTPTQFTDLSTRSKEIVLTPEYPNFTVKKDGNDNRGKLISDFIDAGGSSKYNFFSWSTRQTSLQDIDIILPISLPLDFTSFSATPIEIYYQTSDGLIANNQINITAFDTSGSAITLVGASSLANSTWTKGGITFSGSPTFTAGESFLLKIKLSSKTSGFSRISNIILKYNGR